MGSTRADAAALPHKPPIPVWEPSAAPGDDGRPEAISHAAEGLASTVDYAGLRAAREAAEARAIAVAAADPDWRANHLAAVRLTLALEQDATTRWPGRVRCLYVHTELDRVAMFFAGHHSLRDEVLRRVAEHPGLRASFIPLGDDGRRMRVGVAPPPLPAHDPLSAAELQFINFLVEQALKAWTHGT